MTPPPTTDRADIAVLGAGAAGLMAAIAAGREAARRGRALRIVALDGARTLGAKILVAGGGRCNVTHHAVTEQAYAGGSRNTIRRVLRGFDVPETVGFFRDLGVDLKREDTGKLFPTTDSARTVLDALLRAAREARVELRHPARVARVERAGDAFLLAGEWGDLHADRLVLATGGKALPKTGSDGAGYAFARALGHSITDRVFPALVPLVLDPACPLRALAGLTRPMRIELRAGTGKRLLEFTNSTLCTHFGLSGPAVMDISRHFLDARHHDPAAHLVACFLPEASREALERDLLALGPRRVRTWARALLPERLAEALAAAAGVPPETPGANLKKDARRALLAALLAFPLPVTADRGFTHAEVTAGGVPLDEIDPRTMASRRCPGLFLCGEILDADGRIGGFNFQWAWASGHLAGVAAATPVPP